MRQKLLHTIAPTVLSLGPMLIGFAWFQFDPVQYRLMIRFITQQPLPLLQEAGELVGAVATIAGIVMLLAARYLVRKPHIHDITVERLLVISLWIMIGSCTVFAGIAALSHLWCMLLLCIGYAATFTLCRSQHPQLRSRGPLSRQGNRGLGHPRGVHIHCAQLANAADPQIPPGRQ